MEDVAVNRLATSIAQLTLCQVTTDEIYAATKLLDKACQKLRVERPGGSHEGVGRKKKTPRYP